MLLRRSLRSLVTVCLLCLFSLQALAASGMQGCQHSRATSSAGPHEHHPHHAGMQMQVATSGHDHSAVHGLLKGCGCGCADRHCASPAPGLSATTLSAGFVAIYREVVASTIAPPALRDAHDRDLIRPPSFS